MKRVIISTLAALVFLLPAAASANNAIGTDVVRIFDRNQDDGMMNIIFQHALTRTSAIKASFASGEDLTVLELTYKAYNQRYQNGTYYELGGMYVDGDDDTEIGFTAAVGYETSIARNIILGGAVQMVMIEEEIFGYAESPIFFPRLHVMFAF